MRNAVLLLILSALLLPTAAVAQQPAQPQPASAAAAIAASHLGAARELIDLMRLEEAALVGAMLSFEQQMQLAPELGDYRDVLQEWARGIFSSEEAKQAFARVYAEEISEADLRALIAFYQTPVGQRAAAKQAVLARRGAQVGEQLAAAKQADLMERMRRREQELRNRSH